MIKCNVLSDISFFDVSLYHRRCYDSIQQHDQSHKVCFIAAIYLQNESLLVVISLVVVKYVPNFANKRVLKTVVWDLQN